MQAIETKYLGPTNFRGSRIKATAQAGSITVSWDHALNVEENHRQAALAFIQKWEWHGKWYGGSKADDTGYAFVCAERKDVTNVHINP